MSLINDMLNDLDERRSKSQSNEVALDWMRGQKNTAKSKWQLPLLICTVAAIFLVLAYGLWNYQSSASLAAVDKLATIDAERKQELAPAAAVSNTPVRLAEPTPPDVEVEIAAQNSVDTVATVQMEQTPSIELPAKPDVEKIQKKPETKLKPVLVAKAEKPPEKKAAKTFKTSKPLSLAQQDREQYQRAEKLIRQRNSAEAQVQLQTFVHDNAHAPLAGELLVSLWMSQQQWNKARDLLLKLRIYHPQNPKLLMLDARLAMRDQQPEKAVELLMTESPALADYVDYYELLGLAARKSKQYQLSAEAYQGLLEFDSQRGDWWVGMAIALDMQQQPSAARSAYRQALQSKTLSPALRNYAQQRL